MTSIKVGCATRSLYASPGPKAEGVPTALLVSVQRLGNDLYKDVKGPSTKPIVLSMIARSYFRRRKRFTIFEPDEMIFALSLTPLSL